MVNVSLLFLVLSVTTTYAQIGPDGTGTWAFYTIGPNANLSGANLSGSMLNDADLSGADLSGANLREAMLWETNFSNADLSGANLTDADLSRANLSGANLVDADLTNVKLHDANLSGANLSGADLKWVKFHNADLSNANFRGANLFRAFLIDPVLKGADFSGANLNNASSSQQVYSNTIWTNVVSQSEFDAVVAERDARVSQSEYDAVVAERDARQTRIFELIAEKFMAEIARDNAIATLATAEAERDARPTQAAYNTVVAERDARLTETEVRDLKLGSRMLKVVDGDASINIELEATDDLGITNPTWTPVPESKVIIHPNYLNDNIRIDVQADDESNSGVRFFRFKMDGSDSSSDGINLSIEGSEYDEAAIIQALAEQYGVPASSISLSVTGG